MPREERAYPHLADDLEHITHAGDDLLSLGDLAQNPFLHVVDDERKPIRPADIRERARHLQLAQPIHGDQRIALALTTMLWLAPPLSIGHLARVARFQERLFVVGMAGFERPATLDL